MPRARRLPKPQPPTKNRRQGVIAALFTELLRFSLSHCIFREKSAMAREKSTAVIARVHTANYFFASLLFFRRFGRKQLFIQLGVLANNFVFRVRIDRFAPSLFAAVRIQRKTRAHDFLLQL